MFFYVARYFKQPLDVNNRGFCHQELQITVESWVAVRAKLFERATLYFSFLVHGMLHLSHNFGQMSSDFHHRVDGVQDPSIRWR
jgi:hypothetical protein